MSYEVYNYVRKVKKIKIDGKEYVFSEITVADLAEFKQYVRNKHKKIAYEKHAEVLKTGLDLGDIDHLELLKTADIVSDKEIENESSTLEGLGYLAYLSLKHHHIQITLDEVVRLITPGIVDDIVNIMFPSLEEDDTDKNKKKPNQKQTRKRKSPTQQQ